MIKNCVCACVACSLQKLNAMMSVPAVLTLIPFVSVFASPLKHPLICTNDLDLPSSVRYGEVHPAYRSIEANTMKVSPI